MKRLLSALLLLCLLPLARAVEPSTTVNVSYLAWPTVGNHWSQVTLAATEVIVVTTSDPRRWVTVQMFSPTAWTYRATQSSSTDAVPVAANQIYAVQVQGTGLTFYPVGSGVQTLYISPVAYTTPN